MRAALAAALGGGSGGSVVELDFASFDAWLQPEERVHGSYRPRDEAPAAMAHMRASAAFCASSGLRAAAAKRREASSTVDALDRARARARPRAHLSAQRGGGGDSAVVSAE